jgi:hypothetical protein
MNELVVIEVGSPVMLDGDIPATITALEVRGSEHLLTYQVVFWDERTRKAEWVTPEEIKHAEQRRTIRFGSR